ncbi:MAG: hypothetical protein JWR74_2113 [Polaromonas sp.]|jgi:uncharacterized protein YidB (DUF937 family)|nr:hypothetical protein [Polaromonas sp.]
MGLLDSVLGAVMNNNQPANANAGAGGLGGLMGMLANNPQLISIAMGMLSNDGTQGGLGGLVSKFQQAGLGGAMSSWIGGGPNQAVSGEQITSALGTDAVADIAGKLGVQPGEAAGQLSSLLPDLINQLTPAGKMPDQGLGNGADLMGMLGGLLQAR